jgi:hypothetical protein
MGITVFTCGTVLAPLQQLAAWMVQASPLRPGRRQARAAGSVTPSGQQWANGRSHFAWPASSCAAPLPRRRPLRVVRVLEACSGPASAGRMVISGRMADVCAELDRLAALESQRAC